VPLAKSWSIKAWLPGRRKKNSVSFSVWCWSCTMTWYGALYLKRLCPPSSQTPVTKLPTVVNIEHLQVIFPSSRAEDLNLCRAFLLVPGGTSGWCWKLVQDPTLQISRVMTFRGQGDKVGLFGGVMGCTRTISSSPQPTSTSCDQNLSTGFCNFSLTHLFANHSGVYHLL
jgi:hypothetical protein